MIIWNNKTTNWYVGAGLEEPYARDIAKHISEYIDGMDVVDAGCGPGVTSFYLSEYAKSVVGVDTQDYAIDYAKEKFKDKDNLSFINQNFYTLEKKSCDVVCGISIGAVFEKGFELLEIPRKYLILVSGMKREKFPRHNFGLINEQILIKNNIKYEKFNISTAFGQGFDSEEEALEFIKCYELSENPTDYLAENAMRTERYKFYLANKKEMQILVVECES